MRTTHAGVQASAPGRSMREDTTMPGPRGCPGGPRSFRRRDAGTLPVAAHVTPEIRPWRRGGRADRHDGQCPGCKPRCWSWCCPAVHAAVLSCCACRGAVLQCHATTCLQDLVHLQHGRGGVHLELLDLRRGSGWALLPWRHPAFGIGRALLPCRHSALECNMQPSSNLPPARVAQHHGGQPPCNTIHIQFKASGTPTRRKGKGAHQHSCRFGLPGSAARAPAPRPLGFAEASASPSHRYASPAVIPGTSTPGSPSDQRLIQFWGIYGGSHACVHETRSPGGGTGIYARGGVSESRWRGRQCLLENAEPAGVGKAANRASQA